MPSPAIRCAGRPVSLSDSSHALPAWKGTYPVMTLTRVVLPAPFGPIRPWIDPFSTSSDTPSTARTPPKCRRRSSRRRSIYASARPPRRPDDGKAAAADDALGAEDDDGDQEGAGDDVDVVAGACEYVRQQRHEERPDHRTEHVAAAAEHGEGEDLHRARHAVLGVAGVDEEVQMGLERAGVRGDESAEDEGDHLVARHEDALAQGRDLVLPDRRPGAAEPAL